MARCLVRGVALISVTCALILTGPVASTGGLPDGPEDEFMLVPGGTAGLLKAAGIPARVEPSRAWLVLVRAIHGGMPPDGVRVSVATLEPMLAGAAKSDAPGTDRVPALLPQAVWEEAVFVRRVEPAQLAFSILRDRRASLLYSGLFSLDPDTLAYFADHPLLLASIYSGPAGPFAAFAESLAVRASQVVLPGGAAVAPEWERLVGASAGEPERFIPALLIRDGGRLAWLFDTLASLDDARRLFALHDGLERLYETFSLEKWPVEFSARPFTRPPVDLTVALRTIGVSRDGALAPPADLRLWDRVFAGKGTPGTGGQPPDRWLLRSLAAVGTRERRLRLDTLLFAQRVFGPRIGEDVPEPALNALSQALSAYGAHSALMLTLERLGFTDPGEFAGAARAADALASGMDHYVATLRVAAFQGALAVVARLREVDAVDGDAARTLAQALLRLPAVEATAYGESVVRWVETLLLPSLPGAAGPGGTDAEQILLDGLAGVRAGRSLPVIEWEDHAYRVDVASGERSRLRRIRDSQGRNDLTTLLNLRQLKASGNPAFVPTLLATLSRLGLRDGRPLFAVGEPGTGLEVKGAPPAVPRSQAGAKPGVNFDPVRSWQELLLAELMTSYAYAIALGDPDATMLLAGNPARTHDFEVGGASTWLPARDVRAGTQLILRGSLLGLERALAVPSLRQATLDAPAVAPNLGQTELQGIAESVATLNPFHLEDRDRDSLAAVLSRGRNLIASAARNRNDIDALAARAGVERWRRRLMRLAVGGGASAVMSYWSLGEVCAVGQAEAVAPNARGWGVSLRLLDGSWREALPLRLAVHDLGGRLGIGLLSVQTADLHLRVAEWLAELRLPAALAPGVLRAAAWDLAMNTRMADLDDWLAVVRSAQALPADRMADYVSALTADGPLVPIVQTR